MGDRDEEFIAKIKTISFGVVPGGYRDTNSTSMFDKDAFLDQYGDSHGSKFSEERVKDYQSTFDRKNREATEQVLGG